MSAEDLSSMHLAKLHELAAKRGVAGYRGLHREELIKALENGASDSGGGPDSGGDDAANEPRPRRRRQRSRRGGEGRAERPQRPARDEEPDEAEDEEVESEPVTGVLDITGQGHGFVRLHGLERAEDDVYVSASQVRRCELRVGDEVGGPARGPRRGERHRALIHVDSVNGAPPPAEDRPDFDGLTAVMPTRRLSLDSDEPVVRAAGALAPLAFGQRVLVDAAPRSGRTTLLRGIAKSLAGNDDVKFVVLLVDERPEEATAWREELPGAELAIATADMSPAEQLRTAELALERARRLAERGADAVLIVDSLSRIAAAAGDGGTVKRIFGSGRELEGEETGSLTIIATTLDPDDDASKAVATTENAVIVLSADLAAKGLVPVDATGTRVSNEDKILAPDELENLRGLRSELDGLEPAEAAAKLTEHAGA